MSYNESNFPHPNICTTERSLYLRSASVSSNIHSRLWVTQLNFPDDLQLHLPPLQVMLDDGGRCSAAENEALDLCIQVLGSSLGFPGLGDNCFVLSSVLGPLTASTAEVFQKRNLRSVHLV